MDLRWATLKAVSFYFLHNVSILNQCRTLSCGTVVCKHFASYQNYPNYRWDLIWYAMGQLDTTGWTCSKLNYVISFSTNEQKQTVG
jgi:hypothetical protein